MSRVIVKGLPMYLSEDRLRETFQKKLVKKHESTDISKLLTDVRIMRNKDGESRRFAFVGFRDEDDAFDCVKYFDGSFIDTSKISVSMAKSFADPRVPQPMREKRREALKRLREREEMLLAEKKQKVDKKNVKREGIDAEIAKNKQLQEFIDTMKPSSLSASWEKVHSLKDEVEEMENEDSNSNPLLSQALAMKADDQEEDDGTFQLPRNDSDDEYVDLNKEEGENEEEGEREMMSLSAFDSKTDEEGKEEQHHIANDESVSDLDWLKNRRIRIKEGEDAPAVVGKSDMDNPPTTPINEGKATEPVVEDENEEERALLKIKETGRLFLRNILYSATEQDFRQLFSSYGELEEVHVALDTRTGQSKGFAYILFKNPENAVQAYIELDKQIFQGRLLHILPAEAKKNHRLDEFDLKNLPLKKQRELKRKANASQQTFSWNSLYMNQDAVLGSVAAKLGMEKSELIDAENSSSAVKQALAEASVIGDVRKYFEAKGVDLTKFSQYKKSSARDDRVILVKNFPFGTTKEEIAELFLPFGKLTRLLMPPSGTIAIVQFRDLTAARTAFTKISFKRFKDGIIYLEKGPSDCFTRDPTGDELIDQPEDGSEVGAKEAKITSSDLLESKAVEKSGAEDEEDDVVSGPTVSIFIKNLNFSTTTKELTEKFKPFHGFVVAQVKTKPDPKHAGKSLSMGFGFAEFRTKDQASAVINALEGTVLDGHKLQLKLSHRQGSSGSTSSKKKKNQGKIIVKNLPFEATRKDVFELFSSFGQLKSVRVPKKFDRSARGFAFVEFLLPKEAESAMDQLQGVHLLGRRLVMEFVEEEPEDVEQQIEKMTRKVKKQVNTTKIANMQKASKRKLDLGEDDENDGLTG